MRIGSLFTGYGGLDMAVEDFFDAETVWCSDIDPGACKIIAHRMPCIPNLGDITTIDWASVEPVDILTGGWPCQPFSLAGKRKGSADERALWPFVAGAVRALRPRLVVLENVAAIATAGELARASADLASLGYVGQWRCLRAADVGAPHGRARIFIWAESRDPYGLYRKGWPAARQQGQARFAARLATDTERLGVAGRRGLRDLGGAPSDSAGEGLQRQRDRDAADHRRAVATDTAGSRFGTRIVDDVSRRIQPDIAWGAYAPAIRRWERILGRDAPAPTETSPKGSQRLSPRLVEWMMGLPAGWVCDVPGLTRNEQLKALGNGVVPQQALEALRRMRAAEVAA